MASTPQELIYNEAQRAVALQAASVDELRSRTGVLLAVAALSASFLGRAALEDGDLRGLEIAGGACLGAVGVLAVLILVPWAPRRRSQAPHYAMTDGKGRGWFFTLDARKLKAAFSDKTAEELADVHLALAETLAVDHDENTVPLTWMYRFFEWAAVLLVLGIGLWLADVADL
jgi:hypothetical protein